jgi:hypothetical protein
MALIKVKGEVTGLVFGNKGIQIAESDKTKEGETRQTRFTAWVDEATSLQVGQKVEVEGLLNASIGNYKNKEGEDKTVVNLSINFATVKVAQAEPAQEALPF